MTGDFDKPLAFLRTNTLPYKLKLEKKYSITNLKVDNNLANVITIFKQRRHSKEEPAPTRAK